MKAWLRVVRIPLALTAPLDAIACAFLALSAADISLATFSALDWLALAGTSLCLYCAGMAANDLADRQRDKTIAPDRPLPSGALSPLAVGVVVALLFAGAIWLGGGPRGERWFVVGAAAFAIAYNFGLKRLDLPGAIAMGLVRFANASIVVAPLVAGGAAPAWVFVAPAAIGLYSTAITILSTTEEHDAPARRVTSRVLAAVAFGLAGVAAGLAAMLPTLGMFIAFGVFTSTLFGRTPRPGPAKRMVLEMLLGLYFLEYVIATGGEGGSLWIGAFGFVLALGLVRVSWWTVKWLAR